MSETKAETRSKPEVHRIPPETPLSELVIATEELWNSELGARGVDFIATKDDAAVRAFPHAFVPLLDRLRVAGDLNAVANSLRHSPL